MQINSDKKTRLIKFLKKSFFCLVIFIILFIWFKFPIFFKYWLFNVIIEPPFTPEAFTGLGPIGDIFGGLTALLTSLTLIIVMYSAYLQREANKDAREAMAEQLQQAKEATKNQLRQAKEATEEQLKQAKESTKQQLDLAQSTHEAQIQETKNSFFTNQFYSLLNYKNERIKTLMLRDANNKIISGYEIFTILKMELITNLCIKYKENWDQVTKKVITDVFKDITKRHNNGHTYYEIFTYFEIYSSLFELVETADIDEEQKYFFWTLIRQSTTPSEQITLFYLAPMWDRLHVSLEGSKIFISFGPRNVEGFALNFYKKGHFYTQQWYDFYDNQKKPA